MISQGGSTSKLLNTFEKATRKHPEAFVKFKKTTAQLVVKIKECTYIYRCRISIYHLQLHEWLLIKAAGEPKYKDYIVSKSPK